jgi:tetratricopeptide (TPR) repeat protein
LPSITGPYMGGKYESDRVDYIREVGDRLRPLWEFDDLDASERRLEDQLQKETTSAGRAEVLTQLARVQGLRDLFAEGERLIQQAEDLAGGSAPARARIQLERGRLRRSSGESETALPMFEAAFKIANKAGEEFLAADSAHMAALAAPDRAGKLAWTKRGMEIAEASADRDVTYWLGPLLNNLGFEYADAGDHELALDAFQRALAVRLRYPENPAAIQFAKDSVAEALRALGREEEAARL